MAGALLLADSVTRLSASVFSRSVALWTLLFRIVFFANFQRFPEHFRSRTSSHCRLRYTTEIFNDEVQRFRVSSDSANFFRKYLINQIEGNFFFFSNKLFVLRALRHPCFVPLLGSKISLTVCVHNSSANLANLAMLDPTREISREKCQVVHCEKSLAVFPFPAGMSITKLSRGRD
jgi:hypothetical protein